MSGCSQSEALYTPDQRTPGHHLSAYHRDHPRRDELEAFVCNGFRRRHDATVHSFMPTLLGLHDQQQSLCGVVGYRVASVEPLYLERYLDSPVETLIAGNEALSGGQAVSRDRIVEVGNLASLNCRMAFRLVALLPRYLVKQHQTWVVFTATRTMRAILAGLQAPVVELAPASAQRVAGLSDHWGRYYEEDPRVMAGYLPSGLRLAAGRHRHCDAGRS